MWLSKAWMTLPEKIYFPECGVSEEAVASVNVDNDNPFAGLAEDEEDAVKALATSLNKQTIVTKLTPTLSNTLTLIVNCQPTKVSLQTNISFTKFSEILLMLAQMKTTWK